jgi:hypothetical protein
LINILQAAFQLYKGRKQDQQYINTIYNEGGMGQPLDQGNNFWLPPEKYEEFGRDKKLSLSLELQ